MIIIVFHRMDYTKKRLPGRREPAQRDLLMHLCFEHLEHGLRLRARLEQQAKNACLAQHHRKKARSCELVIPIQTHTRHKHSSQPQRSAESARDVLDIHLTLDGEQSCSAV